MKDKERGYTKGNVPQSSYPWQDVCFMGYDDGTFFVDT